MQAFYSASMHLSMPASALPAQALMRVLRSGCTYPLPDLKRYATMGQTNAAPMIDPASQPLCNTCTARTWPAGQATEVLV